MVDRITLGPIAVTLKPAIPQLPSGDIDKTAAFFEQVLGFGVLSKFPEHGHLVMSRGPAEIHFWKTETEAQAREVGSQSSCYIRVENIQPLFQAFKEAGAPFAYELTAQPWGMREMQVNDPYGNAIRFGEAVDAGADADFYLSDRRALAGTFEKDWFDHVLAQYGGQPSIFEFPPFDPSFLSSACHEQVADFLSHTLNDLGVTPARLLDVGSSLGRGFYEICRRTPSLRKATLVEPSEALAGVFESLFTKDEVRLYPVLTGNASIAEVPFDGRHLREAVRSVGMSLVNAPHEQLAARGLGEFDLVTCFNVLDQCNAPLSLVELLKRHTAPGGVLALSCTYQWSQKRFGTTETPTRQINDLFTDGWTHLSETNIPFTFRKSERHWFLFLSQLSIFQKR